MRKKKEKEFSLTLKEQCRNCIYPDQGILGACYQTFQSWRETHEHDKIECKKFRSKKERKDG